VTLNGSFSGNGNGLTNLTFAALPPGILTNTQTGVTLAGSFSGNGSGLTNLTFAGLPAGIVTNTETGVTLGGAFMGNGSGLTNIPLSALTAANVLTNTETGVTLTGTFTGNGNGLTNLNVTAPSAANYLYSYDTTTQATTTANTFQDVTFNFNSVTNGWTHTTGTANFTCNQTGLYLVQYTVEEGLSLSATVTESTRLVVNGTEVAGSAESVTLNNSTLIMSCSKSCLISIAATDVLKLQFTASSTSGELILPASGSGTKNSASMTAVRIQ
jgi:hypothetical protein